MGEQLPIVGAGAALTVLLTVISMFAYTNFRDRRAYWARTAQLLGQWKDADEAWQVKLSAAEDAHARCEQAMEAERQRRWSEVDVERRARWQVENELAQLRRATGQPDEPH